MFSWLWRSTGSAAPQKTPVLHQGLQDVPPVDDSEPAPTDGDPTPPVPNDDPSLDELFKFYTRIQVKIHALDQMLEKLEAKKIELKSGVSDKEDTHSHAKLKSSSGRLTELAKKVFESAKECVEPADVELEEILDEIRPHITDLSQHINQLCDKLKNPVEKISLADEKTEEENRKIGIDVCDTGIEMICELKDFLEAVNAELNLCLQSEKVGEIALNLVIQMAIFLVTSRSLGLNISFVQPYRNNLNKRIEAEKIHVEIFETDAQATLTKGLEAVSRLAVVLNDPAGNQQLPLASGQVPKMSAAGLFAARGSSKEAVADKHVSFDLKPAM